MSNYAGIDWSMSSPGMVIGNTSDPSELLFFGIRQKKKQSSSASNIILLEPDDLYTCDSERYFKLASRYVNILVDNNVDVVFQEGYAYGASGNTFNIGECTGILKLLLWQNNIELRIIQPSEIKKFATGKGNSNKTAMFEAYSKLNHPLDRLIDDAVTSAKIPSPVNDIIDAYFCLQCGLSQIKQPGQ